ncbi:acyl CoA:acetate/3-ketoacid CoA transferase [Youngiibacter multivorans]|uniref:Propionate CoA-transferase n=1 Tax=Youngiibacter multivorans TaxID=937251 RepID=A0ABS4G7Y4_9CLOT|nr:CoA-transferase [Youngiibacter multivorans]MBP1920680.1 propionate CoA-transferase [Youngiibacter multivorans]
MAKVVAAEFAAGLVKDNDAVGVSGFVGFGTPEELLIALEDRFVSSGKPANLTLFHGAGMGDGKDRGGNHLAHEGLIRRIICAHLGLEPKLSKLIVENKMEAFLVPQGVASHMLRAAGGKKPGVLTHVGLKTFADPRVEACKVNQLSKDSGFEIVSLIDIKGKDYLLYDTVPLDVCFIKGSYADEAGNVTLHKEAVYVDQLELATATRNSGGKVIVQVEKVVKTGSLNTQQVKIPSFLIDYIVLAPDLVKNPQGFHSSTYMPELTGEAKIPLSAIKSIPLDERKVCGRIGAQFLKKGSLVNLGIGVAEAVAAVAAEEGINDKIILSIESGAVGGVPVGGLGIGASINPDALLSQCSNFDIYDGGGIDLAYLGCAQVDRSGNVNVSKFGGRVVGPGGFINITQNAKSVFFCGSMTAGKYDIRVGDGKLDIITDGDKVKFVDQVEQVTFSGDYAKETGQNVYYITERALFKLTEDGVTLVEVAPGVDVEKDILGKMDFIPKIADDLKVMDAKIFTDALMGMVL